MIQCTYSSTSFSFEQIFLLIIRGPTEMTIAQLIQWNKNNDATCPRVNNFQHNPNQHLFLWNRILTLISLCSPTIHWWAITQWKERGSCVKSHGNAQQLIAKTNLMHFQLHSAGTALKMIHLCFLPRYDHHIRWSSFHWIYLTWYHGSSEFSKGYGQSIM